MANTSKSKTGQGNLCNFFVVSYLLPCELFSNLQVLLMTERDYTDDLLDLGSKVDEMSRTRTHA